MIASSLIARLSSFRTDSHRVPNASALEGYRKAQRLSYGAALKVAGELRAGWTEKQAAARLGEELQARGVRALFHVPLAWFGDHSRFDGYRGYREYLPSNRILKPGDVFILDAAPIVDGFIGDIGYTASLGPHAALDEAKVLLRRLRSELPALFESTRTTREIWRYIDQEIARAGYDNCHALYPFAVLAHRIPRVPLSGFRSAGIDIGPASWFSFHTYATLLRRGIFPELLGPDHTGPKEGLWAIEPHIGGEGFGAKFEEILVVEPGRAYWLDDDVPHK
ncbi:MAG: M24 family metallopeptidase [Polyangiaceae bacterium]